MKNYFYLSIPFLLISFSTHGAYNKSSLQKKLNVTNSLLVKSKDFNQAYKEFKKFRKYTSTLKSKADKDFKYLQGLKFALDIIEERKLKAHSGCAKTRSTIFVDFNPHATKTSELPLHAQHTIKLLDSLCKKL